MPAAQPALETQTVLLQRLRAADRRAPGRGWISARDVAAQLDVSLNAVHQAAHRLRLAGWCLSTRSRSTGLLQYALASVGTPPPAPPAAAALAPAAQVLPNISAPTAATLQLAQTQLELIHELMHRDPPPSPQDVDDALAGMGITRLDLATLSQLRQAGYITDPPAPPVEAPPPDPQLP